MARGVSTDRVAEAITRWLREEGSLYIGDLAKRTGYTVKNIRIALERLIADGTVEAHRPDYYIDQYRLKRKDKGMSTTKTAAVGPFGPPVAPRPTTAPEPESVNPAPGERTRDDVLSVDLPVTSSTPTTILHVKPLATVTPGQVDDLAERIQRIIKQRNLALLSARKYFDEWKLARAIADEHQQTIQDAEAALDKAGVPKKAFKFGQRQGRMLTLPERVDRAARLIRFHNARIERQSARHKDDREGWQNTIARLTAELEAARAESGEAAIRAELKRMGSPDLDRASVPVAEHVQKLVDRALKAESMVRKLQSQAAIIGAAGPHSDGSGLG